MTSISIHLLHPHHQLQPFSVQLAMEDLNMLAADGVVICCCCPCLILQIVVYVLLKLPYKLVKKSKRLVHKKLCKTKKKKKKNKMIKKDTKMKRIEGEEYNGGEPHTRIHQENPLNSYHDIDCRWVMDEVDKVLEEFSQQGEFAFGSFWGRADQHRSLPPRLAIDEESFEDNEIVHHHLIEVIKTSMYSSLVSSIFHSIFAELPNRKINPQHA